MSVGDDVSKSVLEFLEGGEQVQVDDAGSGHGGDGSSPQLGEAFLSDDSDESLEDVLVVSSLIDWEGSISLHSEEDEIEGVGHESSDTSGEETGNRLLEDGGLSSLLEVVKEGVEQSQSGGPVEDLSHQSGVETLVEVSKSIFSHQFFGDFYETDFPLSHFGEQLDSDLDHIDGLNTHSSATSRSSS